MPFSISSTPNEVRDALIDAKIIYANERTAVDVEAKQRKKELLAEYRKRRRSLTRLLPAWTTPMIAIVRTATSAGGLLNILANY